jgi:hypothetical protein
MPQIIFSLLILIATSAEAAPLKTCAGLFFTDSAKIILNSAETIQLIEITKQSVQDTTGNRMEEKYAVSDQDENYFHKSLELNLGGLDMRDNPRPGKKNLTETQYVGPFQFIYKGQVRNAKVRVRHYLEFDIATGKILRNALTADHKFLELKVDDPELDKVVEKVRMLLPDKDISAILTPGPLNSSMAEIQKNAEIIASNPKDLIVPMVKFIQSIQQGHPTEWTSSYVTILYERQAWRKTLKAQDGTNVDIQITVDRDIQLQQTKSHGVLVRYPDSTRVIEIKIPLKYARLTEEDLRLVPGLVHLKNAMQFLTERHLDGIKSGHGKLSTTINFLRD